MRRQLEQAKHEKLAALMQVAELQDSGSAGNGRKAAASPSRTDSAKGHAANSPAKQQQQQQQSPAKKGGGWWGSPAKT